MCTTEAWALQAPYSAPAFQCCLLVLVGAVQPAQGAAPVFVSLQDAVLLGCHCVMLAVGARMRQADNVVPGCDAGSLEAPRDTALCQARNLC